MTYLSLLDKIKILFDSLIDFKGILIFSIFMIILTVVYLMKKITAKRYTIGITLSLILLFLISILSNLKAFNKTFDNFMTIFFNGIYFPSIYIYISTLIIVLLAFIVSTININTKKVYKLINKIMFVLNNIIFVIILNIVAKNKIDVFSVNSLYTNTNLVGILEISTGLFLLWIASLIVAYATNSICDRLSRKKEIVKETITSQVVEPVTSDGTEESVPEPVIDDVVQEPILETITNNAIEKPEFNPITSNVINDVVIEPINNNVLDKKYAYDNSSYNNVTQDIEPAINNVTEDSIMEPITNTVTMETPRPKYSYSYSESNNQVIDRPVIENINNNIIYTKPTISNNVTFDDILYGRIPVVYYDNDSTIKEYNITNPQSTYNNITFDKPEETIFSKMVNEDNKEKKLETMINNDNLSIDELSSDTNYSLEDYKKIVKMLNSLKNRSIDHNISIDDAVAISLISNYSIDDCLKLKDILESTLN